MSEHIQLRLGEGGDAVPIGGGQGNFWREVGGRPTFEKLVRKFYEGIESDPVLRPMYPDDDMEGAVQRLTGFLEQYWGGPGTYSQERGHPRLKMRHLPFKVNPDARDRWLRSHAGCGRLARAAAAAGCDTLGVPGPRGARDGQHVRGVISASLDHRGARPAPSGRGAAPARRPCGPRR